MGQFIENNFLQVNAVLQSNSDDVQVGSNVVVVVGSVLSVGKNLKPGIRILKVIYHAPCITSFTFISF